MLIKFIVVSLVVPLYDIICLLDVCQFCYNLLYYSIVVVFGFVFVLVLLVT